MIRIEPWVGFLRLLQFSKSSWGIRLLEEWNYRGSKGKDGDGLEGFPSHQSDDIKSYLDIVDNIYLTYLYSYAVCVPCTFVVTSSWLPYFPSFVLLHESIFTSHLHPTRIHHDTWSIVILCDLAVQERHLFFLFFAISIHPTMLCFFMYLLLLELMQFANPWNFVQSATPATTIQVTLAVKAMLSTEARSVATQHLDSCSLCQVRFVVGVIWLNFCWKVLVLILCV